MVNVNMSKQFKNIILVPHKLGTKFYLDISQLAQYFECPIIVDNEDNYNEIEDNTLKRNIGYRIYKVYKKYFELADCITVIHSDLTVNVHTIKRMWDVMNYSYGLVDAVCGSVYKNNGVRSRVMFKNQVKNFMPLVAEVYEDISLDRFFIFRTNGNFKLNNRKEMLEFKKVFFKPELSAINWGRM